MGRELHLGIAIPRIKKTDTDGSSYVKFGPDVPPDRGYIQSAPAWFHLPLERPGVEGEAALCGEVRPAGSPIATAASGRPGTTPWTKAEGKRQLAETANSFLHGASGVVVDIGRGYTRMLDSGRINLFLIPTLVGHKRQRIHVRLRDHRLLPPTHPDALPPVKQRRAPRRNRARRFEDLGTPAVTGRPAPTTA